MNKFSPFILVLVMLTGCAGLQPYQDNIKVTLVNIQVLESTVLEQRYLVTLRVQNRTQHALSVQGMSFDIDLNGKEFGSGVSNQAVSVEAFDEALLEVKMSSTIFGILRQIQSMQKRENAPFSYRISGRLSTLGSLLSIPFEESGEIDLAGDGE